MPYKEEGQIIESDVVEPQDSDLAVVVRKYLNQQFQGGWSLFDFFFYLFFFLFLSNGPTKTHTLTYIYPPQLPSTTIQNSDVLYLYSCHEVENLKRTVSEHKSKNITIPVRLMAYFAFLCGGFFFQLFCLWTNLRSWNEPQNVSIARKGKV